MYERGAIHGQDDWTAVRGVSTSRNPDFWGIAHASLLHLCAKTTLFEKEAMHDAESQRRGVACTKSRLDDHGTESKFGVVRPLNCRDCFFRSIGALRMESSFSVREALDSGGCYSACSCSEKLSGCSEMSCRCHERVWHWTCAFRSRSSSYRRRLRRRREGRERGPRDLDCRVGCMKLGSLGYVGRGL